MRRDPDMEKFKGFNSRIKKYCSVFVTYTVILRILVIIHSSSKGLHQSSKHHISFTVSKDRKDQNASLSCGWMTPQYLF